ncbi:MAG: SDR family NAD(P)-dependent oxidoreductase [Desulfatibacillaceae bacterium]
METAGKNMVVTGASSGIGLALVRELDRLGARVLAVARTMDKVDTGCENVHTLAMDVSGRENTDALFDRALETLGGIDIFICNAGFAYYGPIGQADWEEIERIYRLNVFSSIYSAQKMRDLHGGRPYRVVITASAMSFLSVPGYALYASTKAALRGFATAYRYELGPDQRLQLVYPIATRTGFFDAAGDDTPVPWPSQTSETVARAIVRGIQKDRDDIFPSLVFRLVNRVGGAFPPAFRMIAERENRKLAAFREQGR